MDTGQTLAYSIVPVASGGGADASKFVIDATTGALAFKTAPNFEAPTDALAPANVYDVTVQVSDNKGGIDKQAIAVTVTDQPEVPLLRALAAAMAQVPARAPAHRRRTIWCSEAVLEATT